MGRDKASLPFGGETLLERTLRLVGEVVDELLVVARQGQPVPKGVRVARDPRNGLGPLAGLATGLSAIGARRAFVTSCDVPFLRPAYVRRMLDLSEDHAITVPLVDGYYMTTSAVYTPEVVPAARELIRGGRLRPRFLVEAFPSRIVREDELRDVDPQLESFRNCNTPLDYEQALRDAGLESKRDRLGPR